MKSVSVVCAVCVVVLLAMGVASRAAAQETVNLASVSGRVVDSQGGVVPGARVTARQIDTNIAAEAVTDSDGRFRFPYLRVGVYEVSVSLDGFSPFVRRLTLTVGSAFELPVTLSVGSVQDNVTVSASAIILEAARSQVAGTVSQLEVQELPMNGRNFLDLALLIPGVSPTNVASTQLFAETSAVIGQGISIGSQRNFSNNYIVDGLSANDDAAGLSGIPYGVDAVDQFQVVTSGGQAELGRSLGGYVNVVTKSGTNVAHGNAYGYFRDDNFNSANALSGTKLPMNQKQYGASVGGPLRRDRTFFFSNVEQRNLDQTGLVTIPQDTVNIINARLATTGYGGMPVSTGIYPNPIRTTNLLGKLDHLVGGHDQIGIRYSLYHVSSDNARGAGGTSAPSGSAGLDNTDQSLAFSNTLTLSARTVNETRAQFVSSDLEAPSTDRVGPVVSIAGVATFGTFSSSPILRRNKMFQVVDNISHQRGAHALRAGADFIYNDDTIANPGAIRGSYTFSSLANFLSGTYNNSGFSQVFGPISATQSNPNIGIYGQDEWKLGSTLTVNAGIRYDLQFIETIRTDRNNLSPRIGIAWSPSALRNTVVRASTGLFYDRVPLRAIANALISAGNSTDLANLRKVSISLSPTQTGAPVFPNILPAYIPSVTLVNLTTMNPNLQNGHSRQVSLEMERQLGERATYSVGYQYLEGDDLVMSINQNVPTCVAAGTNNGCRPISAYANNSQYTSAGESNYHGLQLSFVQRPAARGSLRVSYTLSKSLNNMGEYFFSSPVDPTNVLRDRGRSDDDQRHRLVVNGSVNTSMAPAHTALEQLTHGLRLNAVLQTYSAVPFNITSGVTSLQGTAGRPFADGTISAASFDVKTANLIPRNTGIGDDFFSINLRLSRSFTVGQRIRLEGSAEAFNVTDRRNDVTRIGNFGAAGYPTSPSATFNQVTAVADPRTFQFAVRMSF